MFGFDAPLIDASEVEEMAYNLFVMNEIEKEEAQEKEKEKDNSLFI